MENGSNLMEIVREMLLADKSHADFQFYLEDIPFVVTIGISGMEEKKPDEQ